MAKFPLQQGGPALWTPGTRFYGPRPLLVRSFESCWSHRHVELKLMIACLLFLHWKLLFVNDLFEVILFFIDDLSSTHQVSDQSSGKFFNRSRRVHGKPPGHHAQVRDGLLHHRFVGGEHSSSRPGRVAKLNHNFVAKSEKSLKHIFESKRDRFQFCFENLINHLECFWVSGRGTGVERWTHAVEVRIQRGAVLFYPLFHLSFIDRKSFQPSRMSLSTYFQQIIWINSSAV